MIFGRSKRESSSKSNNQEENWHTEGLTHYKNGEYLKAIEFFDKVLDSYKKDFPNKEYFYMLRLVDKGFALEALQKYDDALICYNHAFESKITTNRHMLSYPFLEKCRLLVRLGRYQEAFDFQDKALLTDLDKSTILHSKGKLFQHLQRYEEALECFNKALPFHPSPDSRLVDKGIVLNELKRHDEALRIFDQLLNIAPFSSFAKECTKHKANSLFLLGRYDEAVTLCENYLKTEKNDWIFYIQGMSFMKLGKNKDAMNCFENAIELSPKYAWAWYQKGMILSSLNKNKDALSAFEKASEDYPQWTDCIEAKNKIRAKLGI